MEERKRLRFVTATVAALCTVTMGLAVSGFAAGDTVWVPAFTVITGIYAVLTWGLFSGRSWAPTLAQGAALFGVASFTQSAIALWSLMPAIAIGLLLHLALGGLALGLDDGLSKRQRWSLRFAGAALVPAAMFALAPDQSGWVVAMVLGGAALVYLGTLGVARGRTWGLLASLVGAPVLATAVALAPSLSWFAVEHYLVAEPLYPLMLDALGLAAAAGALLAVAPFVGPIVRFLLGRPPA